ncbi:MAG: tandem-95 repeat protein, partial [Pseudomonadota bacterium]
TPVNVLVKANDADPDDTVASLTVTVISSSAGTTATAQLNGSIDFDPGVTSGAQTVVYQLTDAQGLSSTATLTINVAPNTPPTGADGSVHFNEDVGYTLQMADFGFADADVGQTCSGIQIETLPAAGSLALNGMAVSAGDLVSTSDINGGRLVFMPTPNEAGSPYASYTFKVQDNMGAFSTAAYTFTFHVDAVNDAPVNTVPDAQTIDEDTTLTFSSANGNLITMADLDAGSGLMSVTLGVANGTLTLSGTANLTFSSGSNASSAMGLIGTVADINAALAGMIYTPDADYSGTETLSLLTADQGNFGSGGALSALAEVTINVASINDAPMATITPASYSATEQTVLNLAGTGLAISDVDAGGLAVQAMLSVTDGMLDVNEGATGVTVITSSVTLVGTVAQINDLLAGLSGGTATYTINTDSPPSADTLTLTVNDLGNTGAGGNRTSSDTATIAITAINDAPTLIATANNPGFTEATGQGVQAPAVNVFSGTLINPIEADQTITGLTFTITGLQDGGHETITVDGTRIVLDASGSSITSGHGVDYAVTVGSGSATVVLTKTAGLSSADAQALINAIAYQNDNVDNPTAGVRLFTLTQIQDSAGTTNGGVDTSVLTTSSSVMVNPANDVPTVSTYTVSGLEDTVVVGQVVASDVDGDALTYSQASNPANGSVSFASDGSFSYTPLANFYGTDSFTVAVSDGNGGTSTATVVITVTAEPVAAGGPGSSGPTQGTVIAAPAVPPLVINNNLPVVTPMEVQGLFDQLSDALDGPDTKPSSTDAVLEESLQVSIRKNQSLTKAVSLAGATSGLYQGSPALFAANQAGGFVFRLEAGGFNLDLLGINDKWLEISKLVIDVPGHPLELSFSPSPERRGHAGPSLSFAETHDDKVAKVEKLAIQMSGTALSVGTVWWAARVSGLIASLMISTPAWRSLDPLPVLGVSDEGDLDEDEYEDDFEDDDDSDLTDDERQMDDKADQMFSQVDAGVTVIGDVR